jgi:molecular chaperone DnaJ
MSLAFDPGVNYYAALGVSEKASQDEIKKAFRKLAKKFHPDSTGGDKAKEAKFKEVNTAYDVLGDAKKRAQYDEMRASPRMPQGFGGGGGFSGQPDMGGVDLGDLFSQVFRGGGFPGSSSGPGSFRYEVYSSDDSDLNDLFNGGGRRGRRR